MLASLTCSLQSAPSSFSLSSKLAQTYSGGELKPNQVLKEPGYLLRKVIFDCLTHSVIIREINEVSMDFIFLLVSGRSAKLLPLPWSRSHPDWDALFAVAVIWTFASIEVLG